MTVGDAFSQMAKEFDLLDQPGLSPTGLTERYLYSTDMKYRYAFARWWGIEDLGQSVVWILLNPATGDTDMKPRPTLERMMKWSRNWEATGVVVVNLFAIRGTDPKVLRSAPDPVGPHNDRALEVFTRIGVRTLAAWGGGGAFRHRSTMVRPYLHAPFCLGTTKEGEPRHPLYVNGATQVVPLP